MNNIENKLLLLITMVFSVLWYKSYRKNCFETPIVFQKLEIIMLENFQGINPIGLGATLDDYNNDKFFTTHKNVTNNLEMKHKKMRGIDPMGLCDSLGLYCFRNWKI